MVLTPEDGKELINLARESILSEFSGSEVEVKEDIVKKFSEKQGVFVTLTIGGELRGCIGFIEPVFLLYKAVIKAAKSAAFGDPRFNVLSEEEFKDVKIEISVLSVPSLIKVEKAEDYLDKIKIGEDGLVVEKDGFSGLLLPQVAPEWKWDVKEFLENTCQKANLDKDCYKDKECKVYKFSAQIFKE